MLYIHVGIDPYPQSIQRNLLPQDHTNQNLTCEIRNFVLRYLDLLLFLLVQSGLMLQRFRFFSKSKTLYVEQISFSFICQFIDILFQLRMVFCVKNRKEKLVKIFQIQICCNFSVSHYMKDVRNVDKLQIVLVVLKYKFVIYLYINLGLQWGRRGGGGCCTCQGIAP